MRNAKSKISIQCGREGLLIRLGSQRSYLGKPTLTLRSERIVDVRQSM